VIAGSAIALNDDVNCTSQDIDPQFPDSGSGAQRAIPA
jgi:hypothetical protein